MIPCCQQSYNMLCCYMQLDNNKHIPSREQCWHVSYQDCLANAAHPHHAVPTPCIPHKHYAHLVPLCTVVPLYCFWPCTANYRQQCSLQGVVQETVQKRRSARAVCASQAGLALLAFCKLCCGGACMLCAGEDASRREAGSGPSQEVPKRHQGIWHHSKVILADHGV